MIVLTTIWIVGFLFAGMFLCGKDVSALWGSEMDYLTKCADTVRDQIAMGVSDFALDVAIILLPVPMVRNSNLGIDGGTDFEIRDRSGNSKWGLAAS